MKIKWSMILEGFNNVLKYMKFKCFEADTSFYIRIQTYIRPYIHTYVPCVFITLSLYISYWSYLLECLNGSTHPLSPQKLKLLIFNIRQCCHSFEFLLRSLFCILFINYTLQTDHIVACWNEERYVCKYV